MMNLRQSDDHKILEQNIDLSKQMQNLRILNIFT